MSTVDLARPLEWRERAPLFLMSGAHGSLHWVVAVFYILMPIIKDEYGLSYAQVGLIGAVIHLSSLAVNIPSGMFVDITGQRFLCQITALVLCGVALMGVGSSNSFWLLIICAAFVSMMNQVWHPAAISYLSELFPDRRGMALSFHTVGASIGDASGYLAAGIIAASIGWQNTAIFSGAIPIVAAVALIIISGKTGRAKAMGSRSGGARSYLAGLKDLMRQSHTWKVILVSGFRGTSQGGLRLYLPLYVAGFFGAGAASSLPFLTIDPASGAASLDLLGYVFKFDSYKAGAEGLIAASVVMAIWQIAGGFATPFAGMASDRFGRKPIFMAGFAGSALILIALPSVTSVYVFLLLIALAGVCIFAVRPVIQSWALDHTPPQLGGSMVSLQFASLAAFGAGIPPVAGLIADAWGLNTVFYFLAGLVVVATAIAATVSNEKATH